MLIRPGAFVLVLCTIAEVSIGTTHAQALYTAPSGVETRWASPENPRGEKGIGDGLSLNALKRIAAAISDTDAAQRMQRAKHKLFDAMRKTA